MKAAEKDLFGPYANRIPRIVEILEQKQVDGIAVTRLLFESWEGSFTETGVGPNAVYAIMARPAESGGGYPGILVCHGGKGGAEEEKAVGWAKEGFVAIVPELPGWTDTETIKSRSRFRNQAYGAGRFASQPAVTASGVFDSIAAGLGAFQLLEGDPQVERTRIGITGVSWGGYLTTLLTGYLGSRVSAAFSLYGGGCYEAGTVFMDSLSQLPEEERRLWLDTYDAARYAAGMTASFLMFPATNDHFFYPPSIMATYNRLPEGRKWICFGPAMDHQMKLPGGTGEEHAASFTRMEPVFFRQAMNGEGAGMLELKKDQVGDGLAVRIEGTVNGPIEMWGYYSLDLSEPWPNREWKPLKLLENHGNAIVFAAPEASVAGYDWFAGVSYTMEDSSGRSTPMSLSTILYREGADGGG